MAFQARQRWMIQKVDSLLGINDEGMVETAFREEKSLAKLNRFIRGTGPPRLFYYYQTLYEPDPDDPDAEPPPPELFATVGTECKIKSTAVYFLRNDKYPNKELDTTVADDDAILYGIVDANPLQTLKNEISTFYKPLFDAKETWGSCDPDQVQDFLYKIDRFADCIKDSLNGLLTGLELRKPDKQFQIELKTAVQMSTEGATLSHFVALVNDWISQTEEYLDDYTATSEDSNAGPSTELEYWRQRMQKLSSVMEQVRTKECKIVLSTLTAASKNPLEGPLKHEINQLLRRWKQIDINITEATNEAKDNVKYLQTLDKFIEPLYNDEPSTIIETLPSLLNSIKMIHTIARYYNTTERMTNLFMKITNQMITNCKKYILHGDNNDILWEDEPGRIIDRMEQCLKLNECYQEQYKITKEKLLAIPKGKQFDFSEAQIFGKFDLFCRRLVKLIDMYSTIQQFKALEEHKLEGLDNLLSNFFRIIEEFKLQRHDLLDYHNNKFDRDFVQFNVRICDLEASLQQFINESFESITSIDNSLNLLRKFQSIIKRESLKNDLDSKFSVIFHNYGLELQNVQELYEKFKSNPPVSRFMPPVAGNIMWSRHLLKRIEDPMRKFESNTTVLSSKESKKIVKLYNKIARTLVAFEYLWYEAWCNSINKATAGLTATLIVKHPETSQLYVNFDSEIFQLIREAKCLTRMGIQIPENARIIMLQEDKFKRYFDELTYILNDYDRILEMVLPITEKLLKPCLDDIEMKLKPGMLTLTWTSMNIDAYKVTITNALKRLEELISTINDITENRIEKNLKIVSKQSLVYLPANESYTLDEFVRKQEIYVNEKTLFLQSKNVEIETALSDLLSLVKSFKVVDPSIEPVSEQEIIRVTKHYNGLMYRSLLQATKESLYAIKKRMCSKSGAGFLFLERPFFEVDVQLAVPSVRLFPTVDDIQRTVNKAAIAVLRATQEVWDWDQSDVEEDQKVPFFNRIGQDKEIVQVCLLLTGGFHGTKNMVSEYLSTFKKYDYLWKDSKEGAYKRFLTKNPTLEDFEKELRRFLSIEQEIDAITPMHNIGALYLNTKNLKLQLKNECRQWKILYSSNLHEQARSQMTELLDYIKSTTTKLGRKVDSLDSLRYVMELLKEVREKESSIEMIINPILDLYQMIEIYLPAGYMTKEEMDQRSVIRSQWKKLIEYSDEIADQLNQIQGGYKRQLIADIKQFQADIIAFRNDYLVHGPTREGITPKEALDSLRRFKNECDIKEKKLEQYRGGEELFALKPVDYPELTKTRKEITLLDQLYTLYRDVVETIDQYNRINWNDVINDISNMTTTIESFDKRCRSLPHKLREWDAYRELRQKITDFMEVLPLLQELSKESMKPRHWEAIQELTGTRLTVDGEPNFKLKVLLDADILQFKDDLEEIADSADKQLEIENKLSECKDKWASYVLQFTPWKNRKISILKGYGQVLEDLEDSIMSLQTMLSMKHVGPFKEHASMKLVQLSETAEILNSWIKVQMMWTSLESVFTGGDIARQMPIEAKKFMKVDKDWSKLMAKAEETQIVVQCCSNELLKNSLPLLHVELEKCQKSLEGYLEQKRGKFPRFYFVSNPVLLQILSQGSDPLSIQPYYEKIFDAIDRVVHDKKEKSKILQIKQLFGDAEEVISLYDTVTAEGNIEDWLNVLEVSMQNTMKKLTVRTAADVGHMTLQDFVNKQCSQLALLGIQLSWTADCEEALLTVKQNKTAVSDCNKKQLAILSEMSSWCLTDLGTKLNRTKIETLITIQVHQRDVFADMTRLYKERKISGPNDFEWMKQVRFYWKYNEDDFLGKGACVIQICDVSFKYRYEYLGCKERLVVTPLTDRAYITLSQALGMNLGGAPAGPAGTGKTETVKDLGRSLGIFVVVTNCTDQQRYTDLAKIFKGLCQGGLWGCFDEFNRIELPVLSVAAQQILAMTNAKRMKVTQFYFPGETHLIPFKDSVGYFVTMNPGYQGRQELPENLKALFRSVAMMVPDREIIIKVKLCSVGYTNFTDLSKKFTVLYRLCEEQLSKQKHYDFGLRNILSVLRTAGKTKCDNPAEDEDMLLMRTLRDMNLSKFVAQDVPLFLSLLRDLFPRCRDPPAKDFGNLRDCIKQAIENKQFIHHDPWVAKIVQLYETVLVRHGIMVVGPAGSGKTATIDSLQDALTLSLGIPHKDVRMNPKAILAEEMFGQTDRLSGEWVDGVFASIWQRYNDRTRKDIRWLICDGPVDALWIENLNSVLDDNKILTLANGDRIPMTDNVKLMFEAENLKNASPATVSRAGIIYVSESNLGWVPIVKAWLKTVNENYSPILHDFFINIIGQDKGTRYGETFRFIMTKCNEPIKCCRVGKIKSMCMLISSLIQHGDFSPTADDLKEELERVFLFALAWTVGGLLELEDRTKFDEYLRTKSKMMPPLAKEGEPAKTIYDYHINIDSMDWELWKADPWEYPQTPYIDYTTLLVPTADSSRSLFLIKAFHEKNKPTMTVGGAGTAKTSTCMMFLEEVETDTMMVKRMNFSSATTAGLFQSSFESELDKRGGRTFGPPGGRKMTLFMDDLSMPEPNEWGDQPTLELVRQLVEVNQFAFLDKDRRGDMKTIEGLQYVAAINHPGSGKNDIPERLKGRFYMFNMTLPDVPVIDGIYGEMIRGWLETNEFADNFQQYVEKIVNGTIQLWQWANKTLLPTPSKFHYSFNMRELSKVFQGILRTTKDEITSPKIFLQLWRHECFRVFSDKLTNFDDKQALLKTQNKILEKIVNNKTYVEMVGKTGMNEAYFVDFLRDDVYDADGTLEQEAPRIYELGPKLEDIRTRVEQFLKEHNDERPSKAMRLVLFDDALKHLMRISRVLGCPKGNLLLVGVGGSGKRSLTQLASYIARQKVYTLTITKNYNINSLLDDLRIIYKAAGQLGQPSTFLFTETMIKDERFLEYINNILTTGEIVGLFPKDEMTMMSGEIRPFALKENPDFVDTLENLAKYFIERVRRNLHLVICMSPMSRMFAERARKFPGLITGTTIDWFLPWPEEALINVSRGFLSSFNIEATDEVKGNLMKHMGFVHNEVVLTCDKYFNQMRRQVYQTPRSFLSFLDNYMKIYSEKLNEIQDNEKRVHLGLTKLADGAKDVEKMKIELADKEKELLLAEQAASEMLGNLQAKSLEAKKESDVVEQIRDKLEAERNAIQVEKDAAAEDLANAKPYLDAADAAVRSIKQSDLVELKKLPKPADIIKIVFDCVIILEMEPLNRVEPTQVALGIGKEKTLIDFLKDSYNMAQKGMLADAKFLTKLFQFCEFKKDLINEETIELLSPYLNLEQFTPAVARNASKAAEGLCAWVRAMAQYHDASKIVKPKLETLRLAEAKLDQAQKELNKAEARLAECKEVLDKLQADFQDKINEKTRIEENAKSTKRRMEKATALIQGLSGEQVRWTEDSKHFASKKKSLIGDVALACAFLSYCGPFNQQYRDILRRDIFLSDLTQRGIPKSDDFELNSFLVDAGTTGEWAVQGLPTDSLSIQNGILVKMSRTTRFPLLIDPQGQGLNWIRALEANNMPDYGSTTLSHPKFRDQLEFAMEEGKTLIITGVEHEVDPLLDPVLEKEIIKKAKTEYIMLGSKMVEMDKSFMLYIFTRLPNPLFTPELQARTTLVDFTVTMKGLEEQLLGRVIQQEQQSLEEQLKSVLASVANNTKALLQLDAALLQRLTDNEGNLLDDEELITVLADTKRKAAEVSEKLVAAAATKATVNEKREHYRPVATRGSVLYFSICDVSLITTMYQTSLGQFLGLFERSMITAPKAVLTGQRVTNIISTLTYITYRYINRGLYVKDKLSFLLCVLLKILTAAEIINQQDVMTLLKGGASLDINTVKRKPFNWMSDSVWLNVIYLSENCQFYNLLVEDMARDEQSWKVWYESDEPEKMPVPMYEMQYESQKEIGLFRRMMIIRTLREDRLILNLQEVIKSIESIVQRDGNVIPVLGPKYIEPCNDSIVTLFEDMTEKTPAICLLSAGADPTESIEQLAKKRKKDITCVSMGEGQDVIAQRIIEESMVNGNWVLLQNCHLDLKYMESLESTFERREEPINEEFRLFITAEPDNNFPIGLLHMSVKLTNEPPKGLKAGMYRSYTIIVDQDILDRQDNNQWRILLYSLCFIHSIVQERRKYGSLGWNIPYEYNNTDLSACITFLEKHMDSGPISWQTLRYMISEVQYGGRITDEIDRRLFNAYVSEWVGPPTLAPNFSFNPSHMVNKMPNDFVYSIPDENDIEVYRQFIQKYPDDDSPEIFGLHPNASLTFRTKEVHQMIATVAETLPKESNTGSGRTREDIVKDKAEELLDKLPKFYDEDFYMTSIDKLGGLGEPLNIFLYQEVQRMENVLEIVHKTLTLLIQALKGEVVMTPDLIDALNSIYDAKPPKTWIYDLTGSEIAWISPTLGIWYTGLIDRDAQLRNWLERGQPNCFWLTGFFNPQGFLTAMRQEITRAHTEDKWSLDDISYYSEVTEYLDKDRIKSQPKEGVLVYGLYLDGAAWNKSDGTLVESIPKQLFHPLPILRVSAMTSSQKKNKAGDYGPYGGYECPCYKYPQRTDKYLIFTVTFPSRDYKPVHWIIRGVALLCCTE